MKKKTAIFIVVCVPLFLLIMSILFSFKCCKLSNFFYTPLYNIVSITIMIGFAYFLTQYNNDGRKQKEIIEKLIQKIIDETTKQKMYDIKDDETISYIRISQKTIDNRLYLLEKYSQKYKFENEIQQAKKNFKDYWEMVSEHIADIEYLKKSRNSLFNYISNMVFSLEQINNKIYEWN